MRERIDSRKPVRKPARQKTQWKHYSKSERQKVERRRNAEKAYRKTRDVAKQLRIPLIP